MPKNETKIFHRQPENKIKKETKSSKINNINNTEEIDIDIDIEIERKIPELEH